MTRSFRFHQRPARARVPGLAVLLLSAALAPAAELPPATGLRLERELPLAASEFSQPVAVAAGSFGRLYVADLGRGSVVRIDAEGRPLFEFESPPSQPGLQPFDLEVIGFKVYVLDAQSNALLRYGDEGAYLDVLQGFADSGFETPRALAVDDRSGRILLAQAVRQVVRLIDPVQRSEFILGGFGARPGEFARPLGTAFGADGSIYVSDTGNARVQRFTSVGNFVAAFGDSLREPRGLATGAAGEILVADPKREAVVLFGPRGGVRDQLRLPGRAPLDVSVVGDTAWVLVSEPPAVLRLRIERASGAQE